MNQIINMFWIVVIFWLLIEMINSRINKNRKIVKFFDEYNNKE